MRIDLRFDTDWVRSPRYGNVLFPVTRLIAGVQFEQEDGSWSQVHDAMVDTGAFVSVVPQFIWRSLKRVVRAEDIYFGGVSQRKVCQIRSDFGVLVWRLTDAKGRLSSPLTAPAFLAKTNRVSLLLGFAGLLDKLEMHFNYEKGEAWVRERSA